MKLDKEHLKIAEVHWVDSISGTGWTLTEGYNGDKPTDCFSIGILIDENDSAITIAQNYGLDPEQICNTMSIPKVAINSMSVSEYNVKMKAYYE